MAKRTTHNGEDSQIFVVENSYKQLASNLLVVEPPASYERVEEVDSVGNRPPSSLFFSRYRRKEAVGDSTKDLPASRTPVKEIRHSQTHSRPSTSKSDMVSALPVVDINQNERVTPLITDKTAKVLVKADIISNGNVAKVINFKDAKAEVQPVTPSNEEIAASPSVSDASASGSASNLKRPLTGGSRNSVLSLRRDKVPTGYSNLDRNLEFGDVNLLMERRRAIYALDTEKESLCQKILDCECLEFNLNTAAIFITVAVLTVVAILVIYVIVQILTKKTQH